MKMAEMNIEIAVEPDTLELTFEIGGGSPPQPMPVPAAGYISGTVTPALTGQIMYRGGIVSGKATIEEG